MKDLVVLILAGGKSERFWPLADKNLLSFIGKRLIEYQVEIIRQAGFPIIGIVSNEENITEFKKIPEISIFLQKKPGQGGAILSAETFFKGKSLLVVNANDIVEPNLYEQVRRWINSPNAEAVLCGYLLNKYLPLGYYTLDDNGLVKGVIEKPKEGRQPSNLVRIVVDYYRDGNKLINYLKKVKTKRDDLYEAAMERMMKDNVKFNLIKYSGYWGILKYPWQTLNLMGHFLDQIKGVKIGKNVKIDRNSFFSGNVFFEDNVRIMENVKIVGPCYIGKNTIIGNNSMVRGSMVGGNCVIGFASDITRSYIGDNSWFHTNYIGDSVVSDNVSFGSGAVCANLRLDEGEMKSVIKGKKVNTYHTKLGVMIGSGVRIGVNTSLMPGIKIGKNSFVGSGVILDQDVPDETFCYQKIKLEFKKNKFKIIEGKREEFKKKLNT